MTQRRQWTEQQDKILKLLRQDQNIKKWSQISKIMENHYQIEGRNQKQCRQRYQNHLKKEIITDRLTESEEQLLFKLHNQYGNRWSIISNLFQGRTDNTLKNHFHSKLRGAIRKINRYLGSKKRRGIKPYPLSIVYKIVKSFAHNGKIINASSTFQGIKNLKNYLLKFSGSNIILQNISSDDQTQKNTAEKLIKMLQWFNTNIPSQENEPNFMQNSLCKIENLQNLKNGLVQINEEKQIQRTNLYSNNFQLFTTFSQKSRIQASDTKDQKQKISKDSLTHSIDIQQKQMTQNDQQDELKPTAIQTNMKNPYQFECLNIDIDNYAHEQNRKCSLDLRLQSFSSFSMELIQDNNSFKRNDTNKSIWAKQLDYQVKIDSCVFE